MSIDALRISTEITISGQTQSATTVAIMGRIDQLLLESSISNGFNIKLVNENSQIIWEKQGIYLDVNETISDIRPGIIPRGKVTITVSDPTDSSGTVTVTFIEKERS